MLTEGNWENECIKSFVGKELALFFVYDDSLAAYDIIKGSRIWSMGSAHLAQIMLIQAKRAFLYQRCLACYLHILVELKNSKYLRKLVVKF